MARTFPIEASYPPTGLRYLQGTLAAHLFDKFEELHRHLFGIIAGRAIIAFLGVNLASPLGMLPERLGPFPFAPFLNILTAGLTAAYLALWWSHWQLTLQLWTQIGVDLCLTTVLVAGTNGIESAFVSFYLLIIIYSSLTLGRNGGMIVAALSAILYTGLITAGQLGILPLGVSGMRREALTFRISLHALGFFSVAFLGTHLSHRIGAVEEELEEKIDSLRQLQTLNEHIVGSIRIGLVTTDLKGRIAVFNSAAEEITEKDGPEVLGSPIQLLIGEEFWLRIQDADLLRDSRPLRHETWISFPSAKRRYLGISVSPLSEQGVRLLGYIISFQDLTEIKRLEEEIRLKDRMAAIGKLAAGIAHEIRNPLTSMRGSVEILRSHLDLSGNDARLIDIFIRESDRLNKVIEDFLHFARPIKYTRAPVDLIPLLRDTGHLLRHSPDVWDKHSIVMDLESQQLNILGNGDQLKQVFWNLAQNALRAMPTGGTLTIQAREGMDGGAEVVFTDTGVGMTQEEKRQLFQPFQSGFAGGAGLGLSIIFQIVEDHDGRISFESEKGRGTRATLYLPPETTAAKSAHIR